MELLRQYPPAVGQVLRLDPSLLTQPTYLAPYPELATFLAQHPEIGRNPSYYFGGVGQQDFGYYEPRNRAISAWENVLIGTVVLLGFVAFFAAAASVIRSVIDHRRWLRASKTQVDVHTKILDRFATNADLLAYIQTPAGRRFLEAAPIAVEAPRALSAPLGRVLWSVQAGLVLAFGGAGLQFVSRRVIEDVGQGLYVMGVVATFLGIGFVLSAIVAYVLSRRLGLLEPLSSGPREGNVASNLPS